MGVTGRRGRRSKYLLDDVKEMGEYWKLKEEALDRTVWRTGFGRGYGPVVREHVMNELTSWCLGMEMHCFFLKYGNTFLRLF